MSASNGALGVTFERALALHRQGQFMPAKALYEAILNIDPAHFDALHLSGVIALQNADFVAAVALITQAIAVNAAEAAAHSHLGFALAKLKRHEAALASIEQALRLDPDLLSALCNCGTLLYEMQRPAEALPHYDHALQLAPDEVNARYHRAIALWGLQRGPEALADYEHVLRLEPGHIGALNNCAIVLHRLGQIPQALACYSTLLQYAPEHGHALAQVVHLSQYLCQWPQLAQRSATLRAAVAHGTPEIPPFILLALDTSRAEQQRAARLWVQAKWRPFQVARPLRPVGRRLRIAYLSADFHEHATAYLMIGVFEAHQQQDLDCIAYSYGPDDGSPIRRRLQAAFARFEDIRALSDEAAAAKIAADGIDILIDLKGYTGDERSAILAARPAPVQVQFLGYPGTMGSTLIDYLIADAFVIPSQHFSDYDEQIVHLPGCYQPNDPQRAIGPCPSRLEAGLPAAGFVFCCFNQSYKITPAVFAQWLGLLDAVPHSVLWLLDAHPQTIANLQREAQARGVDRERLIWAPKLPLTAHLGRLQLADLFLDTAPYNAHTTASDALWVGVPVLTCPGATFAARVAGSLLHALGLDELIAASPQDYAALAYALATEPERLAALKAKLLAARAGAALFDAQGFAEHMAAACQVMWQRFQDGAPAAPIALVRSAGRRPTDQSAALGALKQQGAEFFQLGRYQAALASFQSMVQLQPDHAEALCYCAEMLWRLQQGEAALVYFDQVLQVRPDHPAALNNRGVVLLTLYRYEAALASFEAALRFRPDYVDALVNQGAAQSSLLREQDALDSYERALQLQPHHIDALNNCGNILHRLGRTEAALASFERLLTYAPEHGHAAAQALYLRQHLCQWDGLAERSALLCQAVALGTPFARGVPPFGFLALASSPAEQQQCARQWAGANLAPPVHQPAFSFTGRAPNRRLRVAYLSADFCTHATAFLLIGVLEAQRQHAIDFSAYSYGRDDGSPLRARLQAALGRFDDISALSERAAAEKIHADGIDILIDLKGYTEHHRSPILGFRAAPVQVQFLGYPGTMGSHLVDYLIADRFVIAPAQRAFYDEKIVYLPHCYQPNDDRRRIDPAPTRLAAGLPEHGFVWCCFNQSYKFTPAVFEQWLRLLERVPGSVLWLLATRASAMAQLQRMAQQGGVDPARLIFAPQLPHSAHLARLTLADLFLDTAPVNAHTTASDALWAGVPLLTCPGSSFVSRVAGSLLHTLGLDELIADSAPQYEALAYALATDPARLAALKMTLAAARLNSPLFDSHGFAEAFTAACQAMWQRHAQGLAPADIELT